MTTIVIAIVVLACFTDMAHAGHFYFRIIDSSRREVAITCEDTPFYSIPSQIPRNQFVDFSSTLDMTVPDNPEIVEMLRPSVMYKVTEARMVFTGKFITGRFPSFANQFQFDLSGIKKLTICCQTQDVRSYVLTHLSYFTSVEEIQVVGVDLSNFELGVICSLNSLKKLALSSPAHSIEGTGKRSTEGPTVYRKKKRGSHVFINEVCPSVQIVHIEYDDVQTLFDSRLGRHQSRSIHLRVRSSLHRRIVIPAARFWKILLQQGLSAQQVNEFFRHRSPQQLLTLRTNHPESGPKSILRQILFIGIMKPIQFGVESAQLMSRTVSNPDLTNFGFLRKSNSRLSFCSVPDDESSNPDDGAVTSGQRPLSRAQSAPGSMFSKSSPLVIWILLLRVQDRLTLIWVMFIGLYWNWDVLKMRNVYHISLSRSFLPVSCALKQYRRRRQERASFGFRVGLYRKSGESMNLNMLRLKGPADINNPPASANMFIFKAQPVCINPPASPRRLCRRRRDNGHAIASPRRSSSAIESSWKAAVLWEKNKLQSKNDIVQPVPSENNKSVPGSETSEVPPVPSLIVSTDRPPLKVHAAQQSTSAPILADRFSDASAVPVIACLVTAFVLLLLVLATRCAVVGRSCSEEELRLQRSVLAQQIDQFAIAKRHQQGLPALIADTAAYSDDPHFSFS